MDVYKEWLGIPEGERPPDHYTLLRLVQFEDDAEKVQKNYKKLNGHVRKYATGQYQQQSQDLMNEMARAMLCLTDPDRKREYDESLGREFDEAGSDGRQPLLKALVINKTITKDQAQEAKSFAEARGLTVRDAVVQLKLVDVETATRAYAEELGRGYINLEETIPDDSVLDRVPRAVVKRNQFLPLFIDDDTLIVACAYEATPDLEEEMQLRFGMPMRAMMATPLAINQSITKYYAPGLRDESAAQNVVGKKGGGKPQKAAKKTKSSGPRQKMSQLDPEAKRERQQLGWIIMCWSIVGSVMADQFLIKNIAPSLLASSWLGLSMAPFFLTLFIPPLAVFWVVKSYWK